MMNDKYGLIYAVDKEQEPLNELVKKAKVLDLKNIKTIKTSKEAKLGLGNDSVDVALLYDILHYFTKEERKILYSEVYRILKTKFAAFGLSQKRITTNLLNS